MRFVIHTATAKLSNWTQPTLYKKQSSCRTNYPLPQQSRPWHILQRMFSICGPKFKGVFQSHRDHGSLRRLRCRPIMASGTGASKRSAARSPEFRHIDIGKRGHPASVPIIARQVHRTARLPRGGRLYAQTGVFGFGLSHAGSSSLVQAKVVPSRQMGVMMTASFRAVATIALFIPLRATSRMAHVLRGEKRDTRWIRMLSAS